MTIRQRLEERSASACELCTRDTDLLIHTVSPHSDESMDHSVLICQTCLDQLQSSDTADVNHWRCLNDSMWSTEPPVQVLAYRMLHALRHEGWPAELIDMMYLDEETLKWAKRGLDDEAVIHKDSNGAVLSAGDTVVLIQDLNVKGASFTAKRGTAVRRISLDVNNAEHIEGKVDRQHIVILTKYVRKRNEKE